MKKRIGDTNNHHGIIRIVVGPMFSSQNTHIYYIHKKRVDMLFFGNGWDQGAELADVNPNKHKDESTTDLVYVSFISSIDIYVHIYIYK